MMSERYDHGKSFDAVCSAQYVRCLMTAQIVGNREEGLIMSSELFNDIEEGEMTLDRMLGGIYALLLGLLYFPQGKETHSVLIVTSSNMVSAIKELSQGRRVPKDLNELPIVEYLDGITLTLSIGQEDPK